MKGQRDIASFVLRFTQEMWDNEDGEPQVEWRGHIRHVQSDEEEKFTDFTAAFNFIQQSLAELTLGAMPTADKSYQEKAMRQSFRLWETFAAGYTGMIMNAMQETVQQTVKQSEVLNQQVTESMNQWLQQARQPWWTNRWLAPPQTAGSEEPRSDVQDMERVIQALFGMQQQMAALAERVTMLDGAVHALQALAASEQTVK